jgi:hypothetical protein
MGAEIGLRVDEVNTNSRGASRRSVQYTATGDAVLGNEGDDLLAATAELIIGND